MDHGFETKVDLAAADDLGHILRSVNDLAWHSTLHWTYTGIVWLKQSDLDALVGKVALGLGKVKRSMVRRSVP